jgi:hypothetical protein
LLVRTEKIRGNRISHPGNGLGSCGRAKFTALLLALCAANLAAVFIGFLASFLADVRKRGVKKSS